MSGWDTNGKNSGDSFGLGLPLPFLVPIILARAQRYPVHYTQEEFQRRRRALESDLSLLLAQGWKLVYGDGVRAVLRRRKRTSITRILASILFWMFALPACLLAAVALPIIGGFIAGGVFIALYAVLVRNVGVEYRELTIIFC
jgi:hypothetical protein